MSLRGSAIIPSVGSSAHGNTVVVGIQSIPLILLCVTCECASPSVRALREHLKNVHKVSSLESSKATQTLTTKQELLVSNVSQSPARPVYLNAPNHSRDDNPLDSEVHHRLHPLVGLAVKQGYQCPVCPSCHIASRGLKNHVVQDHRLSEEDVNLRVQSVIQAGTIAVQSLYSGQKTKFFPVNGNEPIGDVIAKISPTANEDPKKTPPAETSLPHSHTSPSLPGTPNRFIPQDRSPTGINDSISPEAVQATLHNLLEPLSNNDLEAENVECSRKTTFIQTTQFDKVLEDCGTSLQHAVFLTAADEACLTQQILALRSSIEKYLSKTSTLLRTMHPSFVHRINLRGNDGPFRLVSAATMKRYAVQIARFMVYIARSSAQSDSSALSVLVTTSAAANNSQLDFTMESIHSILQAELLQVLADFQSVATLNVRNFLAAVAVIPCSTTTYHGSDSTHAAAPYRYADASELTHTLAALQYVCSACAVHEMVQIRRAAETAGGEMQVHSQMSARTQRLFESLSLDKNSSAAFIRKTLDLCMGLSNLEDVSLSFDNCQVHSTCGVIRSTHISLPKLGDAVRSSVEAFRHTLHEDLLLGRTLPTGFMTTAQSLTDNASCRRPGMSFLSNNQNQKNWLQKNMTYVLQGICTPTQNYLSKSPYAFPTELSEASISQRTVMVASLPMWHTRVLRFLSYCQKLQESILFMLHISSGSPARATEIATFRLHNDHYAMRNIVLSQKEITLIARYAKQRNMKGGARPILRFPDAETSRCIITYFALIRPLECEMVRAIYGLQAMREHWYWMFADRGVAFTAKRIRNIVSSALEAADLPVSFADYRHFTSGMVPVVCGSKLKAFISDMIDDFSITGHEQASHSSQTAEQFYARTPHQVSMVSSSYMARNRDWCQQWHTLLGFEPAACRVPPIQTSLSPTQSKGTDESPPHRRPQQDVPDAKRSRISSNPTELQNSEHFVSVKTHGAALVGAGSDLHVPSLRSFENELPVLLTALRDATGDPKAVFKSHMQYIVTASVLADPADKLILMPTGSGKTMCVLLPAALEAPKKLSTIIVVPLLALQTEYEKRAALFNLNVSVRPSQPGSNAFADVYIFTPEFLQNKEFAELLTRLSATESLARIVIDEAHLTFLWASFRNALKNIRLALALVPRDVPRILLSATVPPEDRAALIAHHGISKASLYSMPTLRRNLKFSVDYLQQESQESQPRYRASSGEYSSPETFLVQMTVINLQERLHRLASTREYSNGTFGRILVYAFKRSTCASLYNAFQALKSSSGVPLHLEVLMYHAGLSEQQRDRMHEDWSHAERIDSAQDTAPGFRIMVCTSAFGTGLDCPNIRLSLHAGGANGLVDFIQETGRAGRDGRSSECIMLYCPRYASFIEETIRQRNDGGDIADALRRWFQLQQWALNTNTCRKNWLYGFIDGSNPGICLFDSLSINCDICQKRDGSPLFNLRSSTPSIHATPDTIRPWHTTPTPSSLSSLALSARQRSGAERLSSPIETFEDSRVFQPVVPATARLNSLLTRQGRASQTPSIGSPSFQSPPNLFQSTGSQDIRTVPQTLIATHPQTPYYNNQPTMAPSFLSRQASASSRQLIVPQLSSAPTPTENILKPLTQDAQTALDMTHNLARMGSDLCFPCIIHSSQYLRHDPTTCPWLLNRCFRCFSNSHRISACPIARPPQGFCYKCGLRNVLGQKLHTSDFSYGSTCRLFPLIVLCWALWRSAATQKQIAQDFFPDSLLQNYNALVATSSTGLLQTGMETQLDRLFAEILSDASQPFPTALRIALSFASSTAML